MTSEPKPEVFNGAQLVPGNPGNSGGKPGRSGRPPDEFYDWLDGALRDPKVRERYEAILKHSDPGLFLKALRWGDERLHGRPTQSLEHGGTTTVILKAVRE